MCDDEYEPQQATTPQKFIYSHYMPSIINANLCLQTQRYEFVVIKLY